MADLIDETLTLLSFQGHLKLLILLARNPADNVAVELDNTDIYIVCQVQDKATAFDTTATRQPANPSFKCFFCPAPLAHIFF